MRHRGKRGKGNSTRRTGVFPAWLPGAREGQAPPLVATPHPAFRELHFSPDTGSLFPPTDTAVLSLTTAAMKVAITLLLSALLLMAGRGENAGWVPLFNSADLEGWTEKTKSGNFRVEDGVIVGTAREGLGSTFLCTDRDYADFELEFETKLIDQELNSGVQIRSKTREARADKKYGAVFGPQVEISAGRGGQSFSGNIYGQGLGMWITPKDGRRKHDLLKPDGWNHFRVLAVGDQITTWINGQKVITTTVPADRHAENDRGFIGLQLHGIKDGTGPFEAAWRNLRIREIDPGKKETSTENTP